MKVSALNICRVFYTLEFLVIEIDTYINHLHSHVLDNSSGLSTQTAEKLEFLDSRFGPQMGQIREFFLDQIQHILAHRAKMY